MKLVLITPGTGNFHCGITQRDLALAEGLRASGHPVTIIPLYLPLVTEVPVDTAPIFFGGIQAWLQQKSAVFRRLPHGLSAFLDHPALLRKAAARSGMTSAAEVGAMMVSMLRGEQGHQSGELERLLHWIRDTVQPDAVLLSNALLLGLLRRLKAGLGVPVCCTLQGEDSYIDALPEELAETVWTLIAERGAEADALIPVSHHHQRTMQERTGLPDALFRVVRNGIDFAAYRTRVALPDPPVIGFLARLHPCKGLHLLVDAFIRLQREGRVPPETRLEVAGAETPDQADFVDAQRVKLRAAGLESQAAFHPNLGLEAKQEFLCGLSVLSVPAPYAESFGLYLLEAFASGVPVVQPRHGAFPEILDACAGGLLCETDDASGLADQLALLVNDRALNEKLGRQGLAQGREAFALSAMTRGVLDVFDSLKG